MDVIKIGLIGLIGVLLAVPLKSYKNEYGIYIGLGVCLLILTYSVNYFTRVLEGMESMQTYLGDNFKYLSLLLKAVGAAYVCEFCSGICKDAGYGGIAGQVETMGKMYILLLGMPLLRTLMESIQEIGG
ncbi:MAG: stage III sporulation protein AD [Roseburia sp.]|nr:stage III sporulation protein AD [Ruminococcus sp.]MCM1155598.1 stage III sporulation protein AD [Roseburia sp.]MCM1243634.1 stage III sporulation protein AD [Roseburia sp.]